VPLLLLPSTSVEEVTVGMDEGSNDEISVGCVVCVDTGSIDGCNEGDKEGSSEG